MPNYYVVATLEVDGETKTQVFGPTPRQTVAGMRVKAIKHYFPAAKAEVAVLSAQHNPEKDPIPANVAVIDALPATPIATSSSTAKEAFVGQPRPFIQPARSLQPQRAVAEQAVAVRLRPLEIPHVKTTAVVTPDAPAPVDVAESAVKPAVLEPVKRAYRKRVESDTAPPKFD